MARVTARLGLTRYDADEYYKLALAAYGKKNLEEAILNVENAIALHPHHAEYHAARGFFYMEDGINDKAKEAFDEALAINPYEMLANYGKGQLAYHDKDWDTALNHFIDAVAADPNRPELHYYIALVSHRKGGNDQALQWMIQAQAGFEKADDKRSRDAEKWLREFTKLTALDSG